MLLFSLLLAAGIGLVVVGLLHGDLAAIRSYPWLCLWLSLGVGLGISSSGFFVWSILFYPSEGYIPAEIAFLAALAVALIYRISTKTPAAQAQTRLEAASGLASFSLLHIFFYALLISSLLAFVFMSMARPHGDWDAWAVWNLRARFIFLGGERWMDGFSVALAWAHPDYPLLLPALVARAWIYAGQNTLIAPVLIAMVFTFATLGLLVSSLGILRDKTQGLIAGIVLMGTPFYLELGASQYADIPLGFFFLATLVLFCLAERLPDSSNSWMILAGLMAGFAAWTKNEGLLFLTSAIAARVVVTLGRKRQMPGSRHWINFAIGLLPIFAMIGYLKLQITPLNDPHLTQEWALAIEKLGDPSRYFHIFKSFLLELPLFGGSIIHLPTVLISYALILGRFNLKESLAFSTGLGILGLMLAGYCFFYLITPYDLDYQVKTSLARLQMQLWPSVVFMFFLFVSPVRWLTKNRDTETMPCRESF